MLGYGGFLLLGGRAADLLGRRECLLDFPWRVRGCIAARRRSSTTATLLIATRFIKGVSAAFTAPAGLSIITTTFAEGRARNKALSIYTATGATGFSLGLVIGGLLTEAGWRWVFFLPAPVALIALHRRPPPRARQRRRAPRGRGFDVAGAVTITGAMLLLVYTLVDAPNAGWASARTLASFAGAAALLAAFVIREQSTAERRSCDWASCARRRSCAPTWARWRSSASWVGFQFIATLYMQQLRGWSALETGLAIFPAGVLVAVISTRIAPLVMRFGVTRLIVAGLVSIVAGYALFLPIGLHSSYALAMLPTFLLTGLGFALAFGPLNIAATSGVAARASRASPAACSTRPSSSAARSRWPSSLRSSTPTPARRHAAGDLLDGFKPALVVPLSWPCSASSRWRSGMLAGRARAAVARARAPVELELEAA